MHKSFSVRFVLPMLWVGIIAAPGLLLPVQSAAQSSSTALTVSSTTLPKAFLRQTYGLQLNADGGIPPYNWTLTAGDLPAGMSVNSKGLLAGAPQATGDFHFTVTVIDSSRPGNQRNQELTLHVVAPLFVEWSHPPAIVGSRIEGSLKVSNNTDRDFDLTVIVLAINEMNRATAIGYQHMTLKKNAAGLEILFGESLPRGNYTVNVDAVGEVPAVNAIFRARLVTSAPLRMP